MRSENIRTLFAGLGIVFIQITLLRNLHIFDAEADLVLVFIIWLCTKKNKTESLLLAAFFGFTQDAMTDLWGLNMFAKILTVFILHGYLNRISENRFIFWQIFLIVLGIAFFHNLIFFGVTLFTEVYASEYIAISLLLVSTVFTATLGSFLHIVRNDQ